MNKHIIFMTGLALLLSGNLMAEDNTTMPTINEETLFVNKCSGCHATTRPIDKSKEIAPSLMGVMKHLKMKYPDKTKAVAFIKDFVLHPSKEKAICMPEKIKRFGLMPSQKGNINKEELARVAAWMFDNFPPKDFEGMHHGKGHDASQCKVGH